MFCKNEDKRKFWARLSFRATQGIDAVERDWGVLFWFLFWTSKKGTKEKKSLV